MAAVSRSLILFNSDCQSDFCGVGTSWKRDPSRICLRWVSAASRRSGLSLAPNGYPRVEPPWFRPLLPPRRLRDRPLLVPDDRAFVDDLEFVFPFRDFGRDPG